MLASFTDYLQRWPRLQADPSSKQKNEDRLPNPRARVRLGSPSPQAGSRRDQSAANRQAWANRSAEALTSLCSAATTLAGRHAESGGSGWTVISFARRRCSMSRVRRTPREHLVQNASLRVMSSAVQSPIASHLLGTRYCGVPRTHLSPYRFPAAVSIEAQCEMIPVPTSATGCSPLE